MMLRSGAPISGGKANALQCRGGETTVARGKLEEIKFIKESCKTEILLVLLGTRWFYMVPNTAMPSKTSFSIDI